MAACLPFALQKFQEFVKFQQNLSNLTAFEQIPEIPAKFREILLTKSEEKQVEKQVRYRKVERK